jgi:hypothetical protein
MSGDLEQLASDLASSPERVMREIKQVVSKGSLNVKNQLIQEATASPSFRSVARSIGYDLNVDGNSAEGLIGPQKERDGSAGLLLGYWGQSRGGGGSLPDPINALEAEAPNFTDALQNIAGVILE